MLKEMIQLLESLEEFFKLPNWENRGPEFEDISEGLHKLNVAWKNISVLDRVCLKCLIDGKRVKNKDCVGCQEVDG